MLQAPLARGDLVFQLDPNVLSALFQDGNNAGGTIPVTGVGDPVRWMTDVRSPTPGGGALDTFVDVQQAGTGATLANSPGGTVLNFAGAGNLLGFDADSAPIDGTEGALDSTTLTLILVGQANTGGTGARSFIDLRSDNPVADANSGFGLRYDYGTGQLQGMVQGTPVAGTAVAAGQMFVSTLTWNGAASTASLRVTSLVNQVRQTTTTNSAASSTAIDHDRFRLARTADNAAASSLNGLIGDVYIYNDVLSHDAIHDQLAVSYILEPDLLTLIVNRTTGLVQLQNNSSAPIVIDGYRIKSALSSLNSTGWNSLQDQAFGGSPGNPVWAELGAVSGELSEGFFGGSSSLSIGESLNLGTAYNASIDAHDLSFQFHVAGSDLTLTNGIINYLIAGGVAGDYNENGIVDTADYVVWRKHFGQTFLLPNEGSGQSTGMVDEQDYNFWRSRFGATSGSASGMLQGALNVPEPITLWLCASAAAIAFGRRIARKTRVLASVGLLLAISASAEASVTNDRLYTLGDDSLEVASAGIVVGSGPGNVSPSQTLDSEGPTGAYVDVIVHGDPKYVSVSDRPGAAANGLGASFDGTGDALTGFSVNAPDGFWDNATYFPSGYPRNYESIFAHGIQAWVKPNAATQNVRQDIVVDTLEHGFSINSSNNWALQFDDVLVNSTASVAYGQWTHVMQLSGFDDLVRGRSSTAGALLVNGVAVAARGGVYETGNTQLAFASNQDATGNYFNGALDDVRIFLWGNNVGQTNGGAGPNGQNWGTLNLATDNDWIQQELASRAALLAVPSIPAADVNLDGHVNGNGTGSVATDDVSAFIAFWNYQRRVDDIQVGDWISRQNGDLNYDGRTDLADVFLLRRALISLGSGSFSLSLLNSHFVPEPAAGFLAMIGMTLLAICTGQRRCRKRSRTVPSSELHKLTQRKV